MNEIDTFGITLPVSIWSALFALSKHADRAPSDYLRLLISREARAQLRSRAGHCENLCGVYEGGRHEPERAAA